MAWYNSRNNFFLGLFILLFAVLAFRMFQLTGPEGEMWTEAAAENTIRTISTSAPRGDVYDRNGILLAASRPVYAVEFSRGGMAGREVNESLRKAFEILDRNGETYLDDFPITIGADGWYHFRQTSERIQLLEMYGLPGDTEAREAFAYIKEYYGIDNMDPALPDREARKIMTVRYKLALQGFMRYLPVEIALGVGEKTVIAIEENRHNLEGVSVLPKTQRYYPRGDEASHIIGYMGKIPAAEVDMYVNERGYRASDLVGQYGIERGLEEILRGTYGSRTIQIDSTGRILKEIGEETKAKRGQDVALTIDLEYQKRVKEDLLRGLEVVRTGEIFESRFGEYKIPEKHPGATVGACVVLDAKTGEPLAIVSSGDFDPNVFAGGISDEDWEALQPENPRDPLSPRPLYNFATSMSVQPGSTFKPMVAISALELGLDPNWTIYDPHSMDIGGNKFSCLGSHGAVNLFTGMQASCNFYFYGAGSGRDWARRAELGYSDRINIDVISDYARQFGLGVKSDIEIEESIVPAPTSESKMRTTEGMLRNWLMGQSEYIFTERALRNKEGVLKAIDEIASWTEENPSISDMVGRMLRLGIREEEAQLLAEECKYSYFNYAGWTVVDQLNISIGQGENAYTPLQMAHYMATISTGGMKNSLSLVKALENEGEAKRPPGVQADVDPENLLLVEKAMQRVVTGGTLYIFNKLPFSSMGKTGTAEREGRVNPPDEVAYMEEYLPLINPELAFEDVLEEMGRLLKEFPEIYTSENTAVRRAVLNLSGRDFDRTRLDMFKPEYDHFSWVVALAPAEDPEIAVALLVVQGGLSSSVTPIAREIIGDWFDLKEARQAKGVSDTDWDAFFKMNNEQRELYASRVIGIVPEDSPRAIEALEKEKKEKKKQ